MTLSPVIIFVYSRLEHTKRLITSLNKNKLLKDSEVFVFSDSSSNEKVQKEISKVRKYIKDNIFAKNLKIIERKENFGLSKNIISGLNEVFLKHDKAIILEDDLVLSPYFLDYMNDALSMYSEYENIASISGYMYPIKPNKFSNEYFFLNLIESWGWATWKRAWQKMRLDSTDLKEEILLKNKKKLFCLNNKFDYFKMLDDNIKKKNDSWAVRWYASTFLKDMITLFPNKSFVQNTGMDSSGEHCSPTSLYDTTLVERYNKLEIQEIIEFNNDRRVLENYFFLNKFRRYKELIKLKLINIFKKS